MDSATVWDTNIYLRLAGSSPGCLLQVQLPNNAPVKATDPSAWIPATSRVGDQARIPGRPAGC